MCLHESKGVNMTDRRGAIGWMLSSLAAMCGLLRTPAEAIQSPQGRPTPKSAAEAAPIRGGAIVMCGVGDGGVVAIATVVERADGTVSYDIECHRIFSDKDIEDYVVLRGDVVSWAFDPWEASGLASRLSASGKTMVKFTGSWKQWHAVTPWLLSDIHNCRIAHDGCFDLAHSRMDGSASGMKRPNREHKELVAATMAYGNVMGSRRHAEYDMSPLHGSSEKDVT